MNSLCLSYAAENDFDTFKSTLLPTVNHTLRIVQERTTAFTATCFQLLHAGGGIDTIRHEKLTTVGYVLGATSDGTTAVAEIFDLGSLTIPATAATSHPPSAMLEAAAPIEGTTMSTYSIIMIGAGVLLCIVALGLACILRPSARALEPAARATATVRVHSVRLPLAEAKAASALGSATTPHLRENKHLHVLRERYWSK